MALLSVIRRWHLRDKISIREIARRTKLSPEEFRAAVLGTSSHFGTVTIDPETHTLTFHIEGATFPNWEGTTQVRRYQMSAGVLGYQVTARPNGDIPLTGWKRITR